MIKSFVEFYREFAPIKICLILVENQNPLGADGADGAEVQLFLHMISFVINHRYNDVNFIKNIY